MNLSLRRSREQNLVFSRMIDGSGLWVGPKIQTSLETVGLNGPLRIPSIRAAALFSVVDIILSDQTEVDEPWPPESLVERYPHLCFDAWHASISVGPSMLCAGPSLSLSCSSFCMPTCVGIYVHMCTE